MLTGWNSVPNRYDKRHRHPHHDDVAAEVRRWYTAPTPAIGVMVEEHWFGYLATGPGTVGPRVILSVDRPEEVGEALRDAAGLLGGGEIGLLVDSRQRADALAPALADYGYQPVQDTTYLALVGPVLACPGPPDLSVVDVDDPQLDTWATVKLQGFADSEKPPEADAVAGEVAQRRAEAPLARYRLALLADEPVAVLAHYTGLDQLVFDLATRVPYRHHGIAQVLLSRWVEEGAQAGCRSLIINANDGGRPAALYRRLGFVDEVYWQCRHRRQ